MKQYTAYIIAANILSILLGATAAFMAFSEKPNWGWFLFGAILMASSLKIKSGEDE